MQPFFCSVSLRNPQLFELASEDLGFDRWPRQKRRDFASDFYIYVLSKAPFNQF